MNGCQCDTCRQFGRPAPGLPVPAGWWLLGQPAPVSPFAVLAGRVETSPLTFCSAGCVADWAYAHAAITGPPAAAEPPGLGWPE